MKIIRHRLLKDNIQFLIAIVMAIFLYLFWTSKNILVLLFIGMLLFFIIKKPYLILFSLIIFGFAILISLLKLTTEYQGFIKHRHLKVIFANSMGPVVVYDHTKIQLYIKDQLYFKANEIDVSGYAQIVKNNKYLASQNISSIIWQPQIKLISSMQTFRERSFHYFNNNYQHSSLLSLLFLGIKSHDDLFVDTVRNMNISHFFVISGFHIGLMYLILNKIQKFLKINKIVYIFNTLVLLLIYIFILNFSLSSTRAYMLIVLLNINKYIFKKYFSLHQIFGMTLLLFFIINPISIYSLSFQLSFLATYIIVFARITFINNKDRLWLLPFLFYFLLIPLIMMSFKKVSAYSIIHNLFLSYVFPLFYILSLLSLPFAILNNWLSQSFIILINLLASFNNVIFINDLVANKIIIIYYLLIGTFIIYEIWYLFMEKKSIWLKKD